MVLELAVSKREPSEAAERLKFFGVGNNAALFFSCPDGEHLYLDEDGQECEGFDRMLREAAMTAAEAARDNARNERYSSVLVDVKGDGGKLLITVRHTIEVERH